MLKPKKTQTKQKSSQLEELMTKPHQMVYLVGALCVSVFSLLLVAQSLNTVNQPPIKQHTKALVKGESTKSPQAIKNELKQNYQKELKLILENYLSTRINSQQYHDVRYWLAANLKTQDKLLVLIIPKEYQKLHIELMMTLIREAEILEQGDPSHPKLSHIDSRFREIFRHHGFLN